MQHDKNHEEKARWELHKNAACCFEQVLEAASDKTAVWPVTSHLRNYSSMYLPTSPHGQDVTKRQF